MSDAYVQIVPDSSGKKIQAFENILGANTVEAQAVTAWTSMALREAWTARRTLFRAAR